MGNFAIGIATKITAWVIAAIPIALNLKLLWNEAVSIFENDALLPKIFAVSFGTGFIALLVYIIIHPLITKNKQVPSIKIHPEINAMQELVTPVFNKIAIALDFSDNDEKLIAYALGQGNVHTQYFLIHVVESASASLLGTDSNDYETNKDSERLIYYVKQLEKKGIATEGYLGFNHRASEIVRLVKKLQADMLVLGAHRHTGLKDIIYGETVNTVRHELQIPILIV